MQVDALEFCLLHVELSQGAALLVKKIQVARPKPKTVPLFATGFVGYLGMS
jgi:hypothetical protein